MTRAKRDRVVLHFLPPYCPGRNKHDPVRSPALADQELAAWPLSLLPDRVRWMEPVPLACRPVTVVAGGCSLC